MMKIFRIFKVMGIFDVIQHLSVVVSVSKFP